MTPEEKARVKIDQMFKKSGWKVVDRKDYTSNLQAAAIREGLLEGNKEADYFLFINGQAIGVLEAKKESIDVSCNKVCEQAATYGRSVPKCYKTFSNPLPFLFTSNGKDIFFKDNRNEDDFAPIDHILSPKEMVTLLGEEKFDSYAKLPAVPNDGRLRDCQFQAITNLEESFRQGQRRALIALATGAGKTFTACTAAYRMLNYTPTKRILFLVDRNNLAKQAYEEFGTYRLTESGNTFTDNYVVERLKSANIPVKTSVIISTIHRVYSLLTGATIIDDDNDDTFTTAKDLVMLPENPKLPKDYFDLIFIDECHRSIYGNWKKVIEYFDSAKIVGLTATPIPETLAFFNNNVVVNYTLEQSVADGVNVRDNIYRIKTEETENGGAIRIGDRLKVETKYTGEVQQVTYSASEAKFYTREDLNRSIVNPAQIKLILETYRDRVYTEMFPHREPNMDYLPKTLIFALNEAHANNIVKIAREVFGRHDDIFCQKITYSIDDPNGKIQEFRTSIDFRIAVTCTLVATGTDVKPLEVVMFMREVMSEPLYIQMKGRGTRSISDDALRNVTPNADSKDYYVLVDAVGVTENQKHVPNAGTSGPGQELITLERLLELLTHGNVQDCYLNRIAGTLGRLNRKCEAINLQEFAHVAGVGMHTLSRNIFDALANNTLPPFIDINEDNAERMALVRPLTDNSEAKVLLLKLAAGFQTTLENGTDTLLYAGFSLETARNSVAAFEDYCLTHKDEIEALRIIYNNNENVPITVSMLQDLESKLRSVNNEFLPVRMWEHYALINPSAVRKHNSRDEMNALTNLIQLVRFAFKQIQNLQGILPRANSLFNIWHGRKQFDASEQQVEIMKQLVTFVAQNGACTVRELRTYDQDKANQLIRAYTDRIKADEALTSMANFILYNKTA